MPLLVLYAIPGCGVCDQVGKHFTDMNIAVTEKNIQGNSGLQPELKTKTGGDLRVPVLLTGKKVIAGYNAEKLNLALADAGYIDEEAKTDVKGNIPE